MITVLIAIFASIISVVNPLGAIPMYNSLTVSYTKKERQSSALHISLYYIAILLSFFLVGTYILQFFGISVNAMRIAGGLVILSSGYGLLQGKFEQSRMSDKVKEEALHKQDISFSPMAMPMLSGPGSISLLITYFNEYEEISYKVGIAMMIILSGFIVFLTLRAAPFLDKFLGVSGQRAVSRIMGFLVMSIGIQYIIGGVVALVDSYTK
ncbi:MAG TPA: MarC family protein [Saprospiraceae bacterium]|nr:MarC family protein [Saprospiraceae bacterium]